MAERLLLYHVLLWIEHDKSLPVRSYVISLFKQAKVARSPLRWLPPGEPPGRKKEGLRFSYERIELWKKRPEDLLNLGHVELYPLLPLTHSGATREIVNRMLDLLSGEQHHVFALIGFTFATFMFHNWMLANKEGLSLLGPAETQFG